MGYRFPFPSPWDVRVPPGFGPDDEHDFHTSEPIVGIDNEEHQVTFHVVGRTGLTRRYRAECEGCAEMRGPVVDWRSVQRWVEAHVFGRLAVFERLGPGDFGPDQTYGSRKEVVGTGRARCRVCAGVIAKGEPAYRVAHDFAGDGGWKLTECQAHRRCVDGDDRNCPPKGL